MSIAATGGALFTGNDVTVLFFFIDFVLSISEFFRLSRTLQKFINRSNVDGFSYRSKIRGVLGWKNSSCKNL
jgi:hypothetical protein